MGGILSINGHVVSDLSARTDIFDYIERFHNPRKRRQLEMRQKQDLGLTKPSGEMG